MCCDPRMKSIEFTPRIIVCSFVATSFIFMITANLVFSVVNVYQSRFFEWGVPFHLLGLKSDSVPAHIGCCIIFFGNSLLSAINEERVKPMLSMRTAGKVTLRKRLPVYFIVVVFELLRTLERFIAVLGLLSNISFFIATASGYVVGAVAVDLVAVHDPLVSEFEDDDSDDDDEPTDDTETGHLHHRHRRGAVQHRRTSVQWTPFMTDSESSHH